MFRRAVRALLLVQVLAVLDAQAGGPDQCIDELRQKDEQLLQFQVQLHEAWQQLEHDNRDTARQCTVQLQEKDTQLQKQAAQLQKQAAQLQVQDTQLHRAQAQLLRVEPSDRTAAPAPSANATFCVQRSNMTCVGEPRRFEPQWGASGPFANVTLPPEAGGYSKPAFADVDMAARIILACVSSSGRDRVPRAARWAKGVPGSRVRL